MCAFMYVEMVVLRFSRAGILIVIVVLFISSLYLWLTLQDAEDVVIVCSWCRIMGIESIKTESTLQDEVVIGTFEMPMYVKQFNVVENGVSVLYLDQFVLRGLTELGSIRKSTKNIFFVESSCVLDSNVQENRIVGMRLDARQACSVESAARAHPDRPVYVLHSCPLAEDFALRVPEYVRALLDLHNVFFVAVDLAELSEGWSNPPPFSSTSLGLLALWRFGGTYCDLDTLALRSLNPLGTNYCGSYDNDLVGNVVLNFEPVGYGHSAVTQLLYDLSEKFNEKVWSEDAETYLTQFVIDQCLQLPELEEDCNKLTVYDNTVLFTVDLKDVNLFLNENFVTEFVDRIKRTAFTINYFSHLYSVSEDKDPTEAFISLVEEFCPDVYTRSNHTF